MPTGINGLRYVDNVRFYKNLVIIYIRSKSFSLQLKLYKKDTFKKHFHRFKFSNWNFNFYINCRKGGSSWMDCTISISVRKSTTSISEGNNWLVFLFSIEITPFSKINLILLSYASAPGCTNDFGWFSRKFNIKLLKYGNF